MGLRRSFRLARLEALVDTVPVAMLGTEDMLTTQPRALSARLPRAGTSLRLTRLEAGVFALPQCDHGRTGASHKHWPCR